MSERAHKKVTPKKPTKKSKRTHGEHWLDRIAALTLRLPNGEKATFDISKEVSVPHVGLSELIKLEQTSAARLAFWSGRVADQRYDVQKAKRRLTKAEADADIMCRKFVKDDTDYVLTERTVRSRVDLQPSVKEARSQYDAAEYQLEVLESVRDAVRARTFSVGRLLNINANARD